MEAEYQKKHIRSTKTINKVLSIGADNQYPQIDRLHRSLSLTRNQNHPHKTTKTQIALNKNTKETTKKTKQQHTFAMSYMEKIIAMVISGM
ncbi:hypothetical protein ACN7JQ_001461 [Escherichia coli]